MNEDYEKRHTAYSEFGQRLLIHGAAGGVGSFAVQLAHWRGAHVTASISSGHFEFVRLLGADELIDYRCLVPLLFFVSLAQWAKSSLKKGRAPKKNAFVED